MKTYITFGQIHVHSIGGKTFDKDCLAVVNHDEPGEGRELAFKIFGGVFHNSYEEPGPALLDDLLNYYPRGIIEVN